MLYLANLNRNGLVKVGCTQRLNEKQRQSELKRQFSAPKLKIERMVAVPLGWGSEYQWETKWKQKIKSQIDRLQLFPWKENSTEVFDMTLEDAWALLLSLLKETEIRPDTDFREIDRGKADWRFYEFWLRNLAPLNHSIGKHMYTLRDWRDDLNRWRFGLR